MRVTHFSKNGEPLEPENRLLIVSGCIACRSPSGQESWGARRPWIAAQGAPSKRGSSAGTARRCDQHVPPAGGGSWASPACQRRRTLWPALWSAAASGDERALHLRCEGPSPFRVDGDAGKIRRTRRTWSSTASSTRPWSASRFVGGRSRLRKKAIRNDGCWKSKTPAPVSMPAPDRRRKILWRQRRLIRVGSPMTKRWSRVPLT